MAAPNILQNDHTQVQQPSTAQPSVPFNANDPNAWLSLLTGTMQGTPNAAGNLSALSQGSGIDLRGRYPGYEAARFLTGPEYYNLASQYGFYNSLQPDEHHALFTMINQMMNPGMMVDQARQENQGNAMQATPLLQNQLAAAGAGQGYKEGALLHEQNDANRATNSFAANLFSPNGNLQRGNAIAGLYQSAAPNLNNLGQLQGDAVGTPRNQTGLQAAGDLFGQVAGSGAFGKGGLFGK